VETPPRSALDSDILSERVAQRVLARASELDAERDARGSIAELRTIAMEAGISAQAFDAALAEVGQIEDNLPTTARPPRWRRARTWAAAAAIAALLATGAIGVTRLFPSYGVDYQVQAPIFEEAFLLNCLTADEAAMLIRPALRPRSNVLVAAPAGRGRILTVRGAPSQLENVRAILERYDASDPSACSSEAIPARRM
jgi:hypothetical protein